MAGKRNRARAGGAGAFPGLAKVRRVAIATRRTLELVGLREGWFSSMVEQADIVSEGAVQTLHGAEGYYGSTSLRCVIAADVATADQARLVQLVQSDATARLRLLRLAHREAVSRAAPHTLDVLSAELSVALQPADADSPDRRPVLCVDLDVSAGLLAPAIPDDTVDATGM